VRPAAHFKTATLLSCPGPDPGMLSQFFGFQKYIRWPTLIVISGSGEVRLFMSQSFVYKTQALHHYNVEECLFGRWFAEYFLRGRSCQVHD
jgi:hypothetical protein